MNANVLTCRMRLPNKALTRLRIRVLHVPAGIPIRLPPEPEDLHRQTFETLFDLPALRIAGLRVPIEAGSDAPARFSLSSCFMRLLLQVIRI